MYLVYELKTTEKMEAYLCLERYLDITLGSVKALDHNTIGVFVFPTSVSKTFKASR